MIPFTAARTQVGTLFFLASQNVPDLLHVLEENLVTGWELHPLNEVMHKLPHGTIIPAVYSDQYADTPLQASAIHVFISFYDPDTMQALLWDILEHPETKQRHQQEAAKVLHHMEWEERWAEDPAPWSITNDINGEDDDDE